MNTEVYIYLAIFVTGWAAIAIPMRVLFPNLIAKQLSSKDERLGRLLRKIPPFRLNKLTDSVEKLVEKPQNIRFLKAKFPVTYKWYEFGRKWEFRIVGAYFTFLCLAFHSIIIGAIQHTYINKIIASVWCMLKDLYLVNFTP